MPEQTQLKVQLSGLNLDDGIGGLNVVETKDTP